MIVCPLLSGSSGNATYVESGSSRVLIDAGASGAALEKNLRKIGVDPVSLTHILVTHAHDDHIRGVGVASRRYDLPVYASEGVWNEFANRSCVGRIMTRNMKVFHSSGSGALQLGDLTASYFSTPHDAYDSVGYVLSDGAVKFGLATDFGRVTPSIRQHLLGCDVVLLESNYDYDMLMNGPYPYDLKRRIRGPEGHLSNEEAGSFAVELARAGAKHIYLGHLSENNNNPRLAHKVVKTILEDAGVDLTRDCALHMTKRYEPSLKLIL
ncbi:MAG: MBL fold metallo-hydrolase [Thermoguttaceae bacterium]|nr:MBL fold metallo-hydrolase [Thermoguttaceae bacterium]